MAEHERQTFTADDPAARLVGRDRELAVLRDALAAALAGRGSLVLIGGEAGIGKTTLAETICAEGAERGALTLFGRCFDLAETPPYGPWIEAFARAPRDHTPQPLSNPLAGGSGSGGVASQGALFHQVRDYLAALAASCSVVLHLDDLHWADHASLDLLRILGRDLAGVPLLLVATYRADELTRRHPLYQLLPVLVREAHAIRLDLRPLDENGLRSLAGRYALPPGDEDRLVSYLYDRSAGNPFFAGELLRTLEEEGGLPRDGTAWALGNLDGMGVPPLLRQVLDARIDRLGEEARDLLAAAAVVGQEVPLAVWAAVADTSEDALLTAAAPAVAARLLAETPDLLAVRFAHALVREALYEGLLPLQRRILHRRAAEALVALPQPDPDAVASHFGRAGDPRAVVWLTRAGHRALHSFALTTATARYEVALALLDQHGGEPTERCWLLLALGKTSYLQAARQAAQAYLGEVIAAGETLGDRTLVAFARRWRGLTILSADDLEAWATASEALDDAELARLAARVDESPLELRAGRGTWLTMQTAIGSYARILTYAERWATQPEAPPQPGNFDGYSQGWYALSIAYGMLGRVAEADRALARFAARVREIDHGPAFAFLVGTKLKMLLLPYRADRPAERWHLADEARVIAERTRPHFEYWGETYCAPLMFVAGRWDEPALRFDDGTSPQLASRQQQHAKTFAPHLIARVHRERGQRPEGWAVVNWLLRDGLATAPGTPGVRFDAALGLQLVAADLELDAGDLPAAHAWLAMHDRWLAWSGAVLGRAEGALAWAAYYRATGDIAGARRHTEAALAHANDPRQPLALLAAHRALGELDTADGRYAGAARHLDTALALAAACEAPYERALTLLAIAELRAAESNAAEASAALDDARETFVALGAVPALARADALAARLNTVPPASVALPFGLTAREVEVLRLVAQGLTDAQAADRLSLSPRTIGQHLRSVYNKLGVDNRAAATRIAVERGLA